MSQWCRPAAESSRALFALVVALLAPSPAGAITFQTTLSPIRLYAEPGQALTNEYKLTLAAGQPTTQFRVGVEDWWRSIDGQQSFYVTAGLLPRSCGSWVSVNPAESRVAGGGQLAVRVSVNVPATVKPGGYWCALTIEEVVDPLAIKPDTIGVRFLASISTGIYVYIDPLERSVHIEDISTELSDVVVSLRNQGNTPVPVEGRIEFTRPDAPDPVATVVLERNVLLLDPVPVGRYRTPLPTAELLPPGRYRVRVILDIGLDHFIGAQRDLLVERAAPHEQ